MLDETKTEPTTSPDDGKNSDGKAEGAETQTATTTEAEPKKQFTQDELNKIVQTRLKEESERAKKKAEEEASKAKGEFEKLATTYKGDLDTKTAEHATLTEKYDALAEQVSGLIKAELKALPESIRDLKPSDDPLQILEWLPKAKKAAQSEGVKQPGNGADPKPGVSADLATQADRHLRAKGGYSRF